MAFKGVRARQSGFALVVVLALLVLLLGVVMAYFSRATLERMISSSSASNAEVDLLAYAATSTILDDFEREIEAGSEPEDADFVDAAIQIRRPLWYENVSLGRNVAPSIAPQRVGDAGIANIVKVSRRDTPFFDLGPGYADPAGGTAGGIERASAISTDTPSGNGRRITKERWNAPGLMTAAEQDAFVVPDWIYLARDGSHPTDFSTGSLSALRDQSPSNESAIIGRFAYVVYDTGGLIDVNVVGNGLSDDENALRGRLHQVSLSEGIGDVAMPNFDEFVTWRWPESATNDASDEGGLFDSQRTFLDVIEGEQALISRQDLIRYTNQPGSPIPPAALPYLTTFNRDVNAPVYAPDPDAPRIPLVYFDSEDAPEIEQDQLDPDLLAPDVRFTEDVVLARPDGPIKVEAGTPVMPRRFPLEKLSLLAEENPDPDELMYYFGLEKQADGRFLYDAARLPPNDGPPDVRRLGRLAEVVRFRDGFAPDPDGSGASLPVAREPNFFEILQAVISVGSLGKSGSSPEFTGKLMGVSVTSQGHYFDNTQVLAHSSDSLRFKQALQIGANIIDQWDENNIPTTILYPSGTAGEFIESYGVENLPYITQISTTPFRPNYAIQDAKPRDCLQLWALFDVWNPHQNAVAPSDITEFRIICSAGSASSNVFLGVSSGLMPSGGTTNNPLAKMGVNPSDHGTAYSETNTQWNGGTSHTRKVLEGYDSDGNPVGSATAFYSVPDLNQEMGVELTFPPASYAEPTTVGSGEPNSEGDVPGILLAHHNFNKFPYEPEPVIQGNTVPLDNPAIPEKSKRSRNLQRTLNTWYDGQQMFPYSASLGSGESAPQIRVYDSGHPYSSRGSASGLETEGERGERIYPVGTVFTINPAFLPYWTFDPPLSFASGNTSEPTTEVTTVYANIGVKAHNYQRFNPDRGGNPAVNPPDLLDFELQARINGQWVTYQLIEGWFPQGNTYYYEYVSKSNLLDDTHHSVPGATLGGFYTWMGVFAGNASTSTRIVGAGSSTKVDPRSSRFGLSDLNFNGMGAFLRTNPNPWNGVSTLANSKDWFVPQGSYVLGKNFVNSNPPAGYNPPASAPGFEHHWSPNLPAFYGMVSNNPDVLDAANPMRYSDIDGVIRPADGYWGAMPTIPDREEDRPIMLNRPFRNVGELGYVFRDTPWKTLDFSTRFSGDVGLLDVFSLDESVDAEPLVAGKVNLNTRQPAVLEALIRGSQKMDADSTLSESEAEALAEAIVAESKLAPFRHRGEFVTRVLDRQGAASVVGDTRKIEREAAVRALAEVGSTRTWNLMIDVITQTGKLGPNATAGENFIVDGECRYWVHIAIDRATGEVVSMQREKVSE